MCGICGIISKDGEHVSTEQISAMCKTIVHRGPDDEGIYTYQSFGIGMRRLKIIDLETGNQPIHNEDFSKWIVFNGEVYNFQELREDLLQQGHTFYTHSDTEVIIHLYEQYGKECVKFLNGMFCFAIIDIVSKDFFVARDRLGIKQLYYYEDEKRLIFGSEIKAVLQIVGKDRPLNYSAIDDYFSLLYIPKDKTIYSDITKLPAAHWLEIKNNRTKIENYWDVSFKPIMGSTKDIIEITRQKLEQAIKYQMISDVPLGAFLSGGVDSSLIVAMMANQSSKPVETFSILWDKQSRSFDEREYARIVSEQYKTNHHEFLVNPDIEEVLHSTIDFFDEPFADSSSIPNFYLAKETRNHVTVALSGLGGDELTGGYERYLGMKISRYYNKLPSVLRKSIISKIIHKIPDSKRGFHYSERLKRFVQCSEYEFVHRYFTMISEFNDSEKSQLYSPQMKMALDNKFTASTSFEKILDTCTSEDPLSQILYIDQKTYLVDDLLVLADRMSMAHSLELRVPFLDHTLVEHFAGIDSHIKIRGLSKKYILKKIAEKYVPKKVIYRKKRGLSVPLVLWFRNELKDYVLSLTNKRSIEKSGLLDYQSVRCIINQHIMGIRNNDEKIWSIINLLLWYDRNVSKIY